VHYPSDPLVGDTIGLPSAGQALSGGSPFLYCFPSRSMESERKNIRRPIEITRAETTKPSRYSVELYEAKRATIPRIPMPAGISRSMFATPLPASLEPYLNCALVNTDVGLLDCLLMTPTHSNRSIGEIPAVASAMVRSRSASSSEAEPDCSDVFTEVAIASVMPQLNRACNSADLRSVGFPNASTYRS
jgi:hypothetical protein